MTTPLAIIVVVLVVIVSWLIALTLKYQGIQKLADESADLADAIIREGHVDICKIANEARAEIGGLVAIAKAKVSNAKAGK